MKSQVRERDLELLALGACLANKAYLAKIEPAWFTESGIAGAIERMKAGEKQYVIDLLSSKLGVTTVAENPMDAALAQMQLNTRYRAGMKLVQGLAVGEAGVPSRQVWIETLKKEVEKL